MILRPAEPPALAPVVVADPDPAEDLARIEADNARIAAEIAANDAELEANNAEIATLNAALDTAAIKLAVHATIAAFDWRTLGRGREEFRAEWLRLMEIAIATNGVDGGTARHRDLNARILASVLPAIFGDQEAPL